MTKYNEILSRGLCNGIGSPDSQMCIEAAVCNALGLPHDDDPKCVTDAVRRYKIRLNDVGWSSVTARANGLRKLGIAQLGSLGVVNNADFEDRLTTLHTKILVPKILRSAFPNNEACLDAAKECETNPDFVSIDLAYKSCQSNAKKYHTYEESYAAWSVYFVKSAYSVATYVANAAYNATESVGTDEYLILSADLALQVLQELGSPGCQLLKE